MSVGPPAPILYQCPKCGHAADLQSYDVLGLDPGYVYCNQCNEQVLTDNLKPVDLSMNWPEAGEGGGE